MLLVKMPTFPQSCFDPFQVLCVYVMFMFLSVRDWKKMRKHENNKRKILSFLLPFLFLSIDLNIDVNLYPNTMLGCDMAENYAQLYN